MNNRLVGIAVAIFTTLLALALLWQFRIIVVFVLLSLALAATLRPTVNRVMGKRPAVRVAWILADVVGVLVFGFLMFLVIIRAINEVQRLVEVVSAQEEWGLPVHVGSSGFPGAFLTRLPAPARLFAALTSRLQETVLPRFLNLTQNVAGIITGLTITLFLSIYWIGSQDHFERLWLSLLPSPRRNRARRIWRAVEAAMGGYIRSQVVQSLVFGALLGLGFWALGSRFPVLLAIIGAVARLVPVAGIVVALAITFFVGYLASGNLGLLMFLFLLITLGAQEGWIRPRLALRRWENPILTLVLLLALAEVLGLLGLLIAPPLAVLVQILWYYLSNPQPEVGVAMQVSELREREQRIRERIAALSEPPPPVVTSSLEQLRRLLDRAEPVLQAAFPEEPPEEQAVPDRQ